MSNTARVTLACFFAYFVMSGMLAPIGIVLPPLAEHLGEPVADVATIFSWLTLGILLGSALALVVFDLFTVRVGMLLVYLAITAALLTLRLSDSILALRLSLGVVGTACGIGLAAAASTITQLYAEDHRASMLVITDGSFSVAGIVISTLAVSLVAAGFHWSSPYLAVAAVAAAVVLLVATARFPAERDEETQQAFTATWPAAVWLCIAALFLYTMGQYSLLWWLPTYLEEVLGAPRDAAGAVVARFWTGMLISQLLVAWWVLRIGARRLVLLSVSGAFLGSLPLWMNESLGLLPWLSLLWGIANLGLLKIVISFATLAVPNPSPRLVAALLFGATSGTAISPKVTSVIVAAVDTRAVLQFGSFCYLVLGILVFAAWWLVHRAGDAGLSRTDTHKGVV
ncbi:MFS transporter TsgA [Congregibacter sp.]|uniref:MFS transporter TsgA n=1 Tax=Congregibacter sp. TaxID=2744308 RepID=UPI003F6C0AE2